MSPEPVAWQLSQALEDAERCARDGDVAAAVSALRHFDLVLGRSGADDLDEGTARALHQRIGALRDHLLSAKDRVVNEIQVLRRTREYGSQDPTEGRWIEDRA